MHPLHLGEEGKIRYNALAYVVRPWQKKTDKNIYNFRWDFILNWMSERVGQNNRNNTGNHRDDSSGDVVKAEKQIDENKEADCFKNTYKSQVSKNWEIIEDHISFKFVDENQEAFQQLEVKDLPDRPVPIPGQRGGGQKYTDI